MRIILVLCILLFCFIYSNIKYSRRLNFNKKFDFDTMYVVVIFIVLFIIQAMQKTTGQNDIYVYKESYESFANWSYETFFNECNKFRDPFYYFVGFIFLRLGFSFEIFKICINALYIFSAYKLISNYSVKPTISIIAFLTIGSYNFSFTGLRQTIALSILMFSYKYMIEKKPIKFVTLVILASAFHSSAIIFLIAYFAYHLKQSGFSLAILAVGGIFAIINSRALVAFYTNVIDVNELYSAYLEKEEGLSISGTIIFTSFLIFALVFAYMKKWNANSPKLTHLLLISVVFRFLSFVWFGEFFRISMYFSIFDVLLIADTCTTKIGEENFMPRVKTLAVSGILCLYYLLYI